MPILPGSNFRKRHQNISAINCHGLSLCTIVGEVSVGWQGLGTVATKIKLEYVRAASKAAV